MGISFSGVGSGLPISDWIDALVEVPKSKIDSLTAKQKKLQTKYSTLNTMQSTYKAVNTAATKFTDALHGSASDIFSKVTVTTSDASIVTASVTQASTPAKVKLKVSQVATATERRSYGNDHLAADIFTDTSKKLSELGAVEAGSIKINDATISINPDMTADQFIYAINNSANAGVKAHVEDGQLVLTSTNTGSTDIVVEESRTNLVHLLGLTDDNYLTMGNDAKYTINGGEEKTSSSNSLDSSQTGILGLSLEILSETEGDDPIIIDIQRNPDADSVLEALQTFITNFNKAIVDTDTETGESGNLHGENSLVSIRNRIRTMITSNIEETADYHPIYKSLADIGISSGAPGMDVSEDTTKLVIDKDKFYEAFNKNPAAVKALLIGDSNAGTKGIMQDVKKGLETALDFEHGYFTARQTSLNSELTSLAQNITKKEDALEAYRTKLTNKFNYMDKMISQMNTQFAQMQQQLKTIGVDVGDSSS